jgi:ABC-type lipoprotein export system ATPase subunit
MAARLESDAQTRRYEATSVSKAVSARELYYLYRARHGDVAAVRGLSLEVRQGESVSVLGPSGSGKSTLLGLCEGRFRPSSGELKVLDVEVGQTSCGALRSQRRRAIGVVRQHYHRALPPELSAEEIVALPLRLLGVTRPAARTRARKLLRDAGLNGRADARPSELSGGEQQRVALCAALVKRPRLLLADEPTGELDARASAEIVELLLALAGESGCAALIVTHDPEVAIRTERTIHIRDGRLAAEGTARPVLILDEQGWLRLPRHLREEAGLRERVRAHATSGKIELRAAEGERIGPTPASTSASLDPLEKRFGAEVALNRVSKRYSGEDALFDQLSWTFPPEKLHAVAGASGSGKTTLLNMIALLEHLDDGEVWLGAERVDSLEGDEAARWRQRVLGYVSQHSTLVEFLSARENVELALRLRGLDAEQALTRARTWLERLGLAKLVDRRADMLSGGEQRRVALARALAPAPRVLLADEPTAHLDRVTGRLVIRHLAEAAHEHGTTVIAASHDPDLVSASDSRLLLGSPQTAPRPSLWSRRQAHET